MGKETKEVDYKELQKKDPLGIAAFEEATVMCQEYFDRKEYSGSRGETAQKAMEEFGKLLNEYSNVLKNLTTKMNERLHEAGVIFELHDELVANRMGNGVKSGEKYTAQEFFNFQKPE